MDFYILLHCIMYIVFRLYDSALAIILLKATWLDLTWLILRKITSLGPQTSSVFICIMCGTFLRVSVFVCFTCFCFIWLSRYYFYCWMEREGEERDREMKRREMQTLLTLHGQWWAINWEYTDAETIKWRHVLPKPPNRIHWVAHKNSHQLHQNWPIFIIFHWRTQQQMIIDRSASQRPRYNTELSRWPRHVASHIWGLVGIFFFGGGQVENSWLANSPMPKKT